MRIQSKKHSYYRVFQKDNCSFDKADKENNIFGALKLIEQLYIDGEIPGHVFRNILQEYKDDVCIADFTCYKKEKQEGEGK